MKQKWGLFVLPGERDKMLKKLRRKKLEVFEVRELTQWEKIQYLKYDPILYAGKTYVIMFYATDKEYKKFTKKLRLISVF